MEQSLKDTFFFFTSHGLSWNETHQVRVPSLTPSLFAGMGLQAAIQLAKCSIYIQTITFPCLGFI